MNTHSTPHNDTYRWLALGNVCLGQFMTALDFRAMNVALPTLSLSFHTSIATIQWAIMAYQLTLIGLLLSLARLGDFIGRKRIYQSGYLLYTVASALCGLSQSIGQLIVFRIIEGVGAAMIVANGRAIVSTVFPSNERGKALGFTSMAYHLGFITGPSLGGFLIDRVGWRWIFFINVPTGILATFTAWRLLTESTSVRSSRPSFDPLGGITLILSMVTLLFALNLSGQKGVLGSGVFSPLSFFLAAGLFITLFIHLENRAQEPILELALFRNRLFATSNLSLFLICLSQSALNLLLPFYLQGILRYTPSQVGLFLITGSVVIVVVAPIGGWLSDRLGSRLPCTVGAGLMALSQILFGLLTLHSPPWRIITNLAIWGMGWALFNSPNNSAIFGSVPPQKAGAASGMIATVNQIANSLGVATGGFIFSLWLIHVGAMVSGPPSYSTLASAPTLGMDAFRATCLVFALISVAATLTSAVRGQPARQPLDFQPPAHHNNDRRQGRR